MPAQLPLPLGAQAALGREDFIVAPGNAQAVAFIDSWPAWPVASAALHGPPGAGKSHLVGIWTERSGARRVAASELDGAVSGERGLAVEDWDSSLPTPARDIALFNLMERATPSAPLLVTGAEPPSAWRTALPDLASRFGAMVAFPLWALDDALLARLARKLFDDRQLPVAEAVIDSMVRSLERTPAAIRAFVAELDAASLAQGKPITAPLVRALLAGRETAS